MAHRAHRLHPFMLVLLALLPFWGGTAGCEKAPHRGIYLALQFTYYANTFDGMARALSHEQLDVVYPELGVFDADSGSFQDFQGTFKVPPDGAGSSVDPMARSLATLPARLRTAFGPGIERIAWVYLNRQRPEKGRSEGREQKSRGPYFDLTNPQHHRALIRAARTLRGLGFDGIQLDAEPFPPEDIWPMVALLDTLRSEMGKGFVRSVFAPKFVPNPGASVDSGYVWAEKSFFAALLPYCEQLVIPLYDYGKLAPDPGSYQGRIASVTDDLLGWLQGREKVWLALPAFRPTAHHGAHENLTEAVAALRRGAQAPGGVLVFVYSGAAEDYQPWQGYRD